MRRAIKRLDSSILQQNLIYSSGGSVQNKRIAEILYAEQKYFCAYTDEYLSVTDAMDIEHFNPTLKDTINDNYNNWFLVKHQWNKEKSSKWEKFQPILDPTADDFEERVIYSEGDYFAKSDHDLPATNLVKLLQLDNPALAHKRKQYINRKVDDMANYGQDVVTFFSVLVENDPCSVLYPRAIREEFNIDILELLPP